MIRAWPRGSSALAAVFLLAAPLAGHAMQWLGRESDAENDAIRYSRTTPSDAVAQLQRALDAGRATLKFDARHGYLPSVLEALRIPVSSQALVFSRTSFQRERISPATPRALYFNRDASVSWVPGGDVLEVAAGDPRLGTVFYTLDQRSRARPRFRRQTEACLRCHDTPSSTGGVPGLITRSVYPDRHGEPIFAAGTFLTTDRSPFSERWGGWYVTGTHGAQRHMGNVTGEYSPDGRHLDVTAGANVTDLRSRMDTSRYLTGHSDIVALMVLEHQNAVSNLITRASYRARMALYFDQVRNDDLRRPADFVSGATIATVKTVAEPLVQAMLFVDEAPLTSPVAGTSSFAKEFASQAPAGRDGHSLFELDLKRRLLHYPCSYLIYSPAFDALPARVKEYVYARLWEVLSGQDSSENFAHLTPADRSAIAAILLETKPEFAAMTSRRSVSGR